MKMSGARGLGGSVEPVLLRGNEPLGLVLVASEYHRLPRTREPVNPRTRDPATVYNPCPC